MDREERRFQGRLRLAVRRALLTMAEHVPINSLALALAAKDVERAMALMGAGPGQIEKVLDRTRRVVEEATLRGGRFGAEQVNRMLGAP